jgi:uncharacterized protein YnzC (UPF0291/DUF896 family)
MAFFPYSSAIKIPTVEGLHIIDAIDSREKCIVGLNNIQSKYNAVIEENKLLKSQIDLFKKNSVNSNVPSLGCNVLTKKRVRGDGETQIVLTESTQRGYELCKPFLNRPYHHDSINYHINNYNDIFNEIRKPGYMIRLSEDDEGANLSNLKKEIGLLIDGIDKNLFEYETTTKKKKFLSALCNVVTDFISEMVYVEKILERLDRIVTDINNDEKFIDALFNKFGIKTGIKREIGLIFKGGNVYKLYKTLLNNNLDKTVFANYLDEVEPFFKKSDCDFGLVLIVTDESDRKNDKRFLHLEKNEDVINTICSLKYMILNKYRNEFLSGDQRSFEHLSLCGKNDIIMSTKINEIGIKIMNIINENRTEYEQKILKYLTEKISFDNPATYNRYLSHRPNKNETLLMVLEKAVDLEHCINNTDKNSFAIRGENIVEWYKFFLSIALNDSTIKFKNSFNGLRFNREFKLNIIQELNKISTTMIDPRDIKALYNVKQITNIVMGDHSYPITSDLSGEINSDDDSSIYQKIINNNDANNYAKTVAHRLLALERLHSNRNDFYVRFKRTRDGDNFLNVQSIPFDDNNSFITPFYISVNKDISLKIQKFTSNSGVENWKTNIKRLSQCGSSGYEEIKSNPYENLSKIIENENIKNYNMFDFSLSRIMLSVVMICKTFDNKYIALPIPGEFIDLSYSYKHDYKTLLFEHYKGYSCFNKSIDGYEYDEIAKTYDKIIKYAKSNDYLNYLSRKSKNHGLTSAQLNEKQKKLIDAWINVNDEILLKEEEYASIIDEINKINKEKIIISGNFADLLKIVRYYTKYGSGQSALIRFINNTIYIPVLSTYIMDLYAILFSDVEYPWNDGKYSKRLQRYIFFVFIEKLRSISANNISLIAPLDPNNNILNELGIRINDDPINNFNKYMGISSERKEDNYSSHNSFERASRYLNLRSNIAIDDNRIRTNHNTIESASGIDRFMFGYHLLDFLDIRSDIDTFRRIQFIVPNNGAYILVTLTNDETKSNAGNEILQRPLKDKAFDIDRNNKEFHDEKYNKVYKRYQRITINDDDLIHENQNFKDFSKELYKYIKFVEYIREKLIITVVNFAYNYILGDRLTVVSDDTMSMLLNLYDGDINRILTVK